jgi:DNA-binding MarR family transcriptional regulator
VAAAHISVDEAIAVAEFRSALRAFMHTTEEKARRSGLTPQRYQLLLMIKGAPDRSESLTVTDVADRLQVAQSTATELVTRAEEAGLVQRSGSPKDGRVALVRLTRPGERLLSSCFRDLEEERGQLSAAIAALAKR